MPCCFGLASSKVPAKKWRTRAELIALIEASRQRLTTGLDEPLLIQDLACEVGLSESHFIRLFKWTNGVSPTAYRAKARMTEATRLLTETDMEVGEVVTAVGLASQSSFAREFRLKTGMSPLTWRRKSRLCFSQSGNNLP